LQLKPKPVAAVVFLQSFMQGVIVEAAGYSPNCMRRRMLVVQLQLQLAASQHQHQAAANQHQLRLAASQLQAAAHRAKVC
jgi:hypothetical protein